jgi:hypothetical protein
MTRRHLSVVLALVVVSGVAAHTVVLGLGGDTARAVVGRPLTPLSYAGVARRTSRRTARRTMAAGAYPPGAVTALPGGCGLAGGIYTCGAVRYRPAYSGSTVVYTVVR